MKYSLSLLFAVLFLSCEEIQVEELLTDFSTDNTPITTITTVDTLFESSSVSINWTGNEYAISFSYRLESLSYTDTTKIYASWSQWDTSNTITFTNLDEGIYIFHIKSRFTVENEEAPQQKNLIVDAITGPALRMYPLYQRVVLGETFNMYVYIEYVVDLAGVELHLSYPSTNVSVNSMTPGDILSNSSFFLETISPSEGNIELISTSADFPGYTGSGILTKLTFTALNTGSLDTLHIKDSSILRNSGNVQIDILERVYGLIEVVE